MTDARDPLLDELTRLVAQNRPVLVAPSVLSQIAARVGATPPGPTDAELEAIFRDFGDGQTSAQWRRKVYERCVAVGERLRLALR